MAQAWPSDRPLVRPGKGIKFAVVDGVTGNRSSTWRAWTGRSSDDVYLLELATGPVWKVSHHNDGGVWRIAMTREGAEAAGVQREVVDHWDRSEPTEGWSEGVGVLVPASYLRPASEQLASDVVQIPTSPAHSAIRVRLFFEEAGSAGTEFPAAYPVAVLERSNGGRVYILGEPASLGAEQHAILAHMCDEARSARVDGEEYATDRFVGVLRMREQRALVDLTVS